MPTTSKAEKFTLPGNAKIIMLLFILAGAISLGVTFTHDPIRAWSNILINQFYFLSLALGGAFIVAMCYVVNASWATGLRRVPEAMTSFLPVTLLIGLVLILGLGSLYHWTHPDAVAVDALLQHKSPYLNVPFFVVRMVIIAFIWIFFSRMFVRNSRAQDQTGDFIYTKRNYRYGAIFIVFFAVTYTFSSYDWMMSLEPHWFSTIFSVYTFAGLFFRSIAMVTLIVLILLSAGYLKGIVNENHLHDLAKLIFAFSTFWAYCWFCQYMLIWYANIPEETAYFLHRQEGGWYPIFIANLVVNWVVPFFLLMPRAAKRSKNMLWFVSIFLLFAHWLDIYLMVFPSTIHEPKFNYVEIFTGLGFLSLFFWVVFKSLEKASLVPHKDPYLKESINLHQ